MPVRTVESTPGRPDTITHTEYEPVFAGQPDEDLYPSQVWIERADAAAAYRPSNWSAVQPAFGITVAGEDINGVQSAAAFDDLGRTTAVSGDGAPTVTTAYAAVADVAGQVIGTATTVTTATNTPSSGKNAVTTTRTDQEGRTRTSTVTGFDGTTITTANTYDRLGRAESTTRPTKDLTSAGASSTYYDTLDRIVRTVTADGKNATVTYPDPFTTTSTDVAGHVTDAVTDNAGRAVKAVRHYTKDDGTPATATATTEYGAFGLPVKSTDDKGNTVTTSYDVLGRPVTVDDPDRGQVTTAFYGNGLVDTLTHNGSKNTITYTYDDLGRTTLTKHHDDAAKKDTTTTLTYDTATNGNGQLATAVNDSVTTAYRYDGFGRTAGTDLTVDGTTYSNDTTYDALGRVQDLTYPQAGPTGKTSRLKVTNTYNSYGYLTDTTDTTGLPAGLPGTPLWHAEERNADLALTSATIGTSSALIQTSDYDPLTGRLRSLKTTSSSAGILQNISYSYYDNGDLLGRTQRDLATGDVPRMESYTYDDFERIATWTLANGTTGPRTSAYTYDSVGNLTKVTTTGDNLNNYPAAEIRTYGRQDPKVGPHALASTTATTLGGAESYEYDKQGRLTVAKDDTGKAFRTIVYNAFDLPTTVTDKNGKTTEYLYDAFGTRVKKTGPDGTTIYADSFEKRTTGSGTTWVNYLPGGIGQRVVDSVGSATDEYTLTDMLGSTGASTDTKGSALTNTYFYDPYGQPTDQKGAPLTSTPGDITHGFTGHEMENGLRLINMNGRTYDPASKTFNTADPVIDNHPYTYVNSAPTTHTDPTGYSSQEAGTGLSVPINECYACADGPDGSGDTGDDGTAPTNEMGNLPNNTTPQISDLNAEVNGEAQANLEKTVALAQITDPRAHAEAELKMQGDDLKRKIDASARKSRESQAQRDAAVQALGAELEANDPGGTTCAGFLCSKQPFTDYVVKPMVALVELALGGDSLNEREDEWQHYPEVMNYAVEIGTAPKRSSDLGILGKAVLFGSSVAPGGTYKPIRSIVSDEAKAGASPLVGKMTGGTGRSPYEVNAVNGKFNCPSCAISLDATAAGRPAQAIGDKFGKIIVGADGRKTISGGTLGDVREYAVSAGGGRVRVVTHPWQAIRNMNLNKSSRAIMFGAGKDGKVGHVWNLINDHSGVGPLFQDAQGNHVMSDWSQFERVFIIFTDVRH